MSTSTGYVLGFDYGLKHIGVAVGQFVTRTASPLTTLTAKQGQPNWSDIDLLIIEWRPSTLLVGLPLNMDDSESDMSERARRFAKALASRYRLTVAMVDERLTTRAANEVDPDRAHEVAAVLITQSWLAATFDAT